MANGSALKIPPHSRDAEVSVLGALLMDRDAVISVTEFLKPQHFYDTRHSLIYEAIVELYEKREPVDVLTVADRLKSKKALSDIGGSAYLGDLVTAVPTAAHVEHYGKIVKDQALKRMVASIATKLAQFSFEEGVTAVEVLDRAEQEIFSLSQQHIARSFQPVRDVLSESFDRLDELHKSAGSLRGVPSGFSDIDNLLAGFQRSNLVILAARPGVGKTALSLNIAQQVSVMGHRPVGFFSLEMSKEELVDRLLVAQADIDAWKLKTGKLSEEDFVKLSDAMGELAEAPLFIDDTPALSVLEMRSKSRRLQVDHGLDLLIVDYLQLITGRRLENRVQEVSEISQNLKNLARELKVPVIAISQLNRSVEHRGTKKPQLADLRESGAIEQDADVVMFLWREDEEIVENINLDIAKHRNGPLGQVRLRFKGDRIKFYPREERRKREAA